MLVARPAVADPVGTGTIPDTGALPVPSAPLSVPGDTTSGAAAVTPVTGPIAAQVMAKQAEQEGVGEKLKKAGEDLSAAQQASMAAYQAWQDELAVARQLRAKANNTAAQAYKDAAQLGPYGNYANDLHQLGMLAPGLSGAAPTGPDSQSAALDAQRAEQQATIDQQAYQAAVTHQQQLATAQTGLQTQYDQLTAELTTLRTNNAQALAQADSAQQQIDLKRAVQLGVSTQVNGMVANPKAIQAMQFALSQVGKKYVFATEGPDTYDCSGLMWAAYRSVGYSLPRIANDQYHATAGKSVPISQLLPGDMIFYSDSLSDWTQIYHVAMYIGDDRMVEAYATGMPLRTTTVRWGNFFGATRVFDAVKAPGASSGGGSGHSGGGSSGGGGNPGGGTPTTAPSTPSGGGTVAPPPSSAPPPSGPPSTPPTSSSPTPSPTPSPSTSPTPTPSDTPSAGSSGASSSPSAS